MQLVRRLAEGYAFYFLDYSNMSIVKTFPQD